MSKSIRKKRKNRRRKNKKYWRRRWRYGRSVDDPAEGPAGPGGLEFETAADQYYETRLRQALSRTAMADSGDCVKK